MFSTRTGIAAAAMALLAACGEATKEPVDVAASSPRVVSVVAATELDWPEGFEAPGTVRARTTATLAARTMGYIRDVVPHEGDHVAAGQVVVTLEAPDLEAARQQARAALDEARSAIPEADGGIRSAEAQLQLAETTLGRMQELLDKRSISRQEFDEAAARVAVARSARDMAGARRQQLDRKVRQGEEAVAAAEVQLRFLEVKAPFAGRVTARLAEPGTLASPSVPLLEVEREGPQRLEVAVPETHLQAVRAGQAVAVRLDALTGAALTGVALTGRVEEIVPEIDSASRTFLVKIALPARDDVRSGLFGRARFSTGTRRVLTVPSAAIVEQGQLRAVLVAEGGVARSRQVRVGEERDGRLEVLAGLTAGEQVVVAPRGLADGQRVEVSP